MDRLEARVFGEVQGVGFRYFVRTEARRAGVSGFVRNEPDGSVLVVAEGETDELRRLLAVLREGPRAARVSEVAERWQPWQGEFDGFAVAF